MIRILSESFNAAGILSILCWITSLATLASCARSQKRNVFYLWALVIAVVAVILAGVNSSHVSDIQVDRTAQYEEARLNQQKMRDESDGPGAVRVRFAEDSREDRLDMAGVSTEEAQLITGSSEPEYRQKGKQSRDAGKAVDKQASDESQAATAIEETPLVMKEAEVLLANRLDKFNLLLVRLALYLSLLLVIVDYAWRFNRLLQPYFALPLSGRVIEHLFPKNKVVALLSSKESWNKAFLESVVQKGETFVYLGKADPWEVSALPRLVIGPVRRWWLDKIEYGSEKYPEEDEFFYDAAWFNRYCVVVSSMPASEKFLSGLISYLDHRCVTRATATPTVNVLWSWPDMPQEQVLRRIASLARETNVRFIFTPSKMSDDDLESVFDEVYRKLPPLKDSPDFEPPRMKAAAIESSPKPIVSSRPSGEALRSPAVTHEIQKEKSLEERAPEQHVSEPVSSPETRPAPESQSAPQTGQGHESPPAPPVPEAADILTCICPICSQALSAQKAWIGMTVSCPACKTDIVVPGNDGEIAQINSAVGTKDPVPDTEQAEFKFKCTSCGQKLGAKREWSGMSVNCPVCSQALIVPFCPPAETHQ